MSSDGEMHVSTEALLQLSEALRRYQAKVDTAMSDVNRNIGTRLQRLNEACDEARWEVRRRRDDLSARDEDEDYGRLQSRLERAEEHYHRIERRIREVEDVLRVFKRSRAGVQDSLSRGIPRAVGYLESKHTELIEYLSVGLPGEHGIAGVAEKSFSPRESIASPFAAPAADDVAAFPLPAGFHWVRLEDISRADDLRSEEKFSKVSLEEVENGFQLLKQEILPAIQNDPTRSVDYFRQCDTEMNRTYAGGALRVFEAFFGESHIVLSRHPDDESLRVTNGRHRIHVARELGWSSVPARTI